MRHCFVVATDTLDPSATQEGAHDMAAPVEQVGVIIACPSCGIDVLQKTMIPLGVVDGVITYACVACARRLVATTAVTA